MDIEIALGTFYSQGDERRLFQGFKEIAAVKGVKGVGVNLILSIDLRLLGKESLRELIAVLWRYGIPLAPLCLLADRKRFEWLKDKQKYWYKSLFDVKTQTRSRMYKSPRKRAAR